MTIITVLGFTKPNFIKRKGGDKQRVIRDEIFIIEVKTTVRDKETIANVINQGIIASANNTFEQVIKH